MSNQDILDLPAETIKASINWYEKKFDETYITGKEVEEKFKVSKQLQTSLIKAGKLIVVTRGNRVYYPRDFAEAYFAQYVAKQQARVSTREAKKQKVGRPKKTVSWRKTKFKGQAIVIPDRYTSPRPFFDDMFKYFYTLYPQVFAADGRLLVATDQWKDSEAKKEFDELNVEAKNIGLLFVGVNGKGG